MAVSLELPLLVIDIQRGGPSTGLPTKTEQSDLLHAMFGRHGEAPVPIVAPMTPSHCFEVAIEAVRIAVKYRTPVIVLSDGYLANGAEPWRLPDPDTLPDLHVEFATEANHTDDDGIRRLLALHPGRGDIGAALGRARHARARAPHRGPGEAGRLGQRLVRPGQPRAHGPPARRQGGRHRPGHPPHRGGRPRRRGGRPRAGAGVGVDLRRHRRRRPPHPGPRPLGGPRPAGASQPLRPQPGRGAGCLRQGAGARGQPGPAGQAGAAPSSWSTPRRCRRSRASPSAPRRSRRPCWRCWGSRRATTAEEEDVAS